MIDVVSVSLMRRSDKKTAEKVSEKELMYRAGRAVFELLPVSDSYAVVCGKGNNGGDGYVVAELLYNAGRRVTVYNTADLTTETAGYYLQKCLQCGVNVVSYTDQSFEETVIVDCIFGIGFHGAPTGKEAEAIKKINKSGSYIVSVDINSGLDANNGLTELCVISDLTVAIQAPKPGHYLNSAKDVIKKLTTIDIGIETDGETYKLCEADDFRSVFPHRQNNSHKGTYGTAVLLGGCREYSGAVKLANTSLSALKCGCGISRLAVHESIADYAAPYLLESTLCPLRSFDDTELAKAFDKAAAVGLGMGFGREDDRVNAVKYALKNLSCPLLIDADGLYALSKLDYKANGNVIITPHAAEFARLSGKTTDEVLSDTIGLSVSYAKEHNVTVLLKGASTVITDGERVFIVDRGTPGMATAGSGDVLSGIITGINSQNPTDLCLNAACGAFIAGYAGELAAKEKNVISMTASDTVSNIHKAVSLIINS
ncbi:MAG: NAD(P)H-hydrate dehydratase [Clostridia bacterium]|nr:NAD(P)H-hydrate dehydratase [Clostridia bacterium]